MACLYDQSQAGHSPRVGTALDGRGIYGKWADSLTLPALDACGGRFGVPPDSTTGAVEYYYVMQDFPPFTVGCLGPALSGGQEQLVTLEECRAVSPGCGDGDTIVVTTSDL